MVFMDYTMPVMTGSDATHVLREELHYEGYVIGVTGNVLPDDLSRFVASGANLVLLKPLRSPDLDLVLGYIAGHGLQCDLTRRLRIDSVQRVVIADPYVNQDDG
jgi:CheY-like chemotaxis protein